jgi:hypothetical protein
LAVAVSWRADRRTLEERGDNGVMISPTIRPIEARDFEAWLPLRNAYNAEARPLYDQLARPTSFVVYER